MALNDYESSEERGQPVELYQFIYGENPTDFYAYTNADWQITHDSIDYEPLPLTRDKINSKGKLDGKPLGTLGTTLRRHFGLCAVPEERNGHGAVPDFTLADNSILTARNRQDMVNWGIINSRTATGR